MNHIKYNLKSFSGLLETEVTPILCACILLLLHVLGLLDSATERNCDPSKGRELFGQRHGNATQSQFSRMWLCTWDAFISGPSVVSSK